MIRVIGSLNEDRRPYIREYDVISTAMNAGAAVTYLETANTLSLYTTPTALPMWGVTTHAVASSATGKAKVELIPCGAILEADVSEIFNTTALVATGGSGTTFVDSSLVSGADNFFIGGEIQVVTMASGDSAVGTKLAITDSTQSSGTLTFASVGATGFAASDTAQINKLSNQYVAGNYRLGLDTSTADSIVLNQAITVGDSFRCIGTNHDGTKLHLVSTAGLDSPSALTA